MPELDQMVKRQLKYILYLLSVLVLGWGFTDYQAIFAGLILGTSMSMFNVWLLSRKTKQVAEAAASGRSVRSIGTASRYATAILAAMIALKYPDHVNIYSTVAGLMAAYVVMIIDFFIHKSNVSNEEER
ncbi:MAG: ATP synthase subunit I [Bacillus sp. (in: firmicutes)]